MNRIILASLPVIAIFFVPTMNYIDRETVSWVEYHAYDEAPPFPGYLTTMNILHDCVSDIFPYYGYRKLPNMSERILIINDSENKEPLSLIDKKTYMFRNGMRLAPSVLVNEEIAENTEDNNNLYTFFFGK